jgi:tetratricopeptide (TPR) repeat protein
MLPSAPRARLLHFALSPIVGIALVAVPAVAQDTKILTQIQALWSAAETAQKLREFPRAEELYRRSLLLTDQLAADQDNVRAAVFKNLAGIDDALGKRDSATDLLLERVNLLERHPEDGIDATDVGVALFDLLGRYALAHELEKAENVANRAVGFYQNCGRLQAQSPKCDRGLADVQGLMGSAYIIDGRWDLAESWIQSVVERRDDEVRGEVLVVAFRAYIKILADRGESELAAAVFRRALAYEREHPDVLKRVALSPLTAATPPAPK